MKVTDRLEINLRTEGSCDFCSQGHEVYILVEVTLGRPWVGGHLSIRRGWGVRRQGKCKLGRRGHVIKVEDRNSSGCLQGACGGRVGGKQG